MEKTLDELLEEFKELRAEHEGRMSEPVRKLLRRIHERIWIETEPANSILKE